MTSFAHQLAPANKSPTSTVPLHAAHNLGKKESTPDAMARRTKLMRSAI